MDLQGTLNVSVEDNGRNSVPLLQNGHRNAAFEFCKGSATVQQLMLQADTAGDDGQEYVLSFEATPAGSQKLPIEPFKLSFLFYDGMEVFIYHHMIIFNSIVICQLVILLGNLATLSFSLKLFTSCRMTQYFFLAIARFWY